MNSTFAKIDETTQNQPRPSQHFREEHIEIKKHLHHIEEWTGELKSLSPEKQKEQMQKIVKFFVEHIKPHADWEEKKLYPAVDKRTAKSSDAFTTTMRYEHKIVGRWINDLSDEAKKKPSNPNHFSRKTDQLLGLIYAHFEEEEEVLLPILDKTMSAEDFKKEID